MKLKVKLTALLMLARIAWATFPPKLTDQESALGSELDSY